MKKMLLIMLLLSIFCVWASATFGGMIIQKFSSGGGPGGDVMLWDATNDALIWEALVGDNLLWDASGDVVWWDASGDAAMWEAAAAGGDKLLWEN